MSEEVNSNFVIFGGTVLQSGRSGSIRCVGILICYERENLFVYCPLYEMGKGDDLSIETGLGLSIFPNVSNMFDVCRSLLSSSGVELSVPTSSLEGILGTETPFGHIDPKFKLGQIMQLPNFDLSVHTTEGSIRIARNAQGSLTVTLAEETERRSRAGK